MSRSPQRKFTYEQQLMMDETIADCSAKMRDIGLHPASYGEHVVPTPNGWDPNCMLLGRCSYIDADNGVVKIECAARLDRDEARETLFHELTHSVPGCYNHARPFLAACRMIDEEYGTYCELERIHWSCLSRFKVTFRLTFRFLGKVGDQYGVTSHDGTSSLPLYEIVQILPDGRRKVCDLTSGRTFVADFIEIRAMRYHRFWYREQNANFVETLRSATAASDKRNFMEVDQNVTLVEDNSGHTTAVVGCGLSLETIGVDSDGFHLVREPYTGSTFSADFVEVAARSYRRRYLAVEAIMRSNIGPITHTWMSCTARNCKEAILSLAALLESIWNINDLYCDNASASTLKSPLHTLDTRILDAAERCCRELDETLQFACTAFVRYAKRRGIFRSNTALQMLAEYL